MRLLLSQLLDRVPRPGRLELTRTAWVGVVLTAVPLAIAAFGPLFSPYPPDEIIGTAYAAPSGHHPLGLDFVGRDVLSRFLNGGRTSILIALLGTRASATRSASRSASSRRTGAAGSTSSSAG